MQLTHGSDPLHEDLEGFVHEALDHAQYRSLPNPFPHANAGAVTADAVTTVSMTPIQSRVLLQDTAVQSPQHSALQYASAQYDWKRSGRSTGLDVAIWVNNSDAQVCLPAWYLKLGHPSI